MKLRSLTEFSIYLDQRPGELAGLLGMLRAGGVECAALSVSEHNGRGLVRLLGEPVDIFRTIAESLADRGVGPVVEAQVLAVDVEQRPSVIQDLAVALADHGINMRYAYMVPARNGLAAHLVFRVDDLDSVLSTIEAMDWPHAADTASGEA